MQVEPKHFEIIKSILEKYKLEIYIFGSRSKFTAKNFSDLDLVCKTKITRKDYTDITMAFEDSDIPYKVDFVLWDEISEEFKGQIKKDLVKFK